MRRERILITVKTYPTLSRKYGETVCTAGIREDGSWVRIYPVPFRRLDEKEQYKKFDWIECRLVRNTSDHRPESHCPVDVLDLVPVGHLDTRDNWRERRKQILKTATVHTNINNLISAAKENSLSLAVYKPRKILDFVWESETREWDPAKVDEMRNKCKQKELFSEEKWRETFELIPKLPYSFSYCFEDGDGKHRKLQILDWEAGQLYWNCLKSSGQDEQVALAKVKAKYFDAFNSKDLHLFLGTTQQFHQVAPNPWVIVGVFPIPHELQPDLF